MTHSTLGEQIFLQLKNNILLGYYKPGDRLRYNEISERLNTSITPIKEALVRLEEAGLVVSIPRKGTFVATLTKEDIVEYAYIRLALEDLAVDLALSKGIDEDSFNTLEAINNQLKYFMETNQSQECIEKDIEFHNTIISLSGNQKLIKLFEQMILTNLFIMVGKQEKMVALGDYVYKTHQKIINELKNKQADKVKTLLRKNTLDVHFDESSLYFLGKTTKISSKVQFTAQ